MRPTRKFILAFLLVLLVLLLACQVSGTATPAASDRPGRCTPGTQPFTYVNQENGLTVHYPNGWTTQSPAQGDQALVVFLSPDQSVQSELFVSTAPVGRYGRIRHRPDGRQRPAGAGLISPS